MLPTFLIIGTMKGGTTSLYNYLRGHPQVFMSTTKELHYFVAEKNLSRGKGGTSGTSVTRVMPLPSGRPLPTTPSTRSTRESRSVSRTPCRG